MKTKKSMSGKAIAANRLNAAKSTGPRSSAGKLAVAHNAVRHGLLARRLVFRDAEEEAEFNALLDELQDGFHPGILERMFIEEAGVSWWKLQKALDWELQEIPNRRKAAKALLRAVTKNYNEEQLPIFTNDDGSRSGAAIGWDCEELIIQTGTTESEQEEKSRSSDRTGKSNHVQVVARLNTSLETVLRYQTVAKRDFYRAIATLRDMRRERSVGGRVPSSAIDTSAAGDEQ